MFLLTSKLTVVVHHDLLNAPVICNHCPSIKNNGSKGNLQGNNIYPTVLGKCSFCDFAMEFYVVKSRTMSIIRCILSMGL